MLTLMPDFLTLQANPADLSTADSSSGHSDATRYNSDSDRSPTVQSYSPMWTLTPQLPGQVGM